MCQEHWDSLRSAIIDRGMGHLIAKDAEELAKGKKFEPLIGAHNAVMFNLVSIGGVALMLQEGCPLCFANKMHIQNCKDDNCSFTYDEWIDRAADDALSTYRKLAN